jgi:hypothetical protein
MKPSAFVPEERKKKKKKKNLLPKDHQLESVGISWNILIIAIISGCSGGHSPFVNTVWENVAARNPKDSHKTAKETRSAFLILTIFLIVILIVFNHF